MNKKTLEELKLKLQQEKEKIEKELNNFAKKGDEQGAGNWDTRYPKFNGGGETDLEEEASEVEEYGNLLPVEHNLEMRLKDINSALEKIQGKGYGKCEKCGKAIDERRLEACPEAKLCDKCK